MYKRQVQTIPMNLLGRKSCSAEASTIFEFHLHCIAFENIEGGSHGYYHLEDKRIAINARSIAANNMEEAITAAKELGFPLIIRAAYTLGL